MRFTRVIPRLDIKGPNLVKGIHLEGLRVLGKPDFFAELYYKQGADELIFQDTVASLYQRNNLTEIIRKTAKNIFIPLTVGGGIRSLNDMNTVLRAGADKVSLNTAAIADPELINRASQVFGSSTIVIAIEANKVGNSYLAFTDNGREETGREVSAWANEVEGRGAGEILLTSIDREGTGNGFDIDLIKLVTDTVSIPVIAHGGAGNCSHTIEPIQEGEAAAIAISSLLHYSLIGKKSSFNEKYIIEGNTEFLDKKNSYKDFKNTNITEIKNYLTNHEINVRY